jgi:hypothetical protein
VALELVDDTGSQRRLRSDKSKIDVVFLDESEQCRDIGGGYIYVLCLL